MLGFPLILFYFKCRGSFLKKVFIEVVTVLLLLFLFQFWGRKVCGDLSSLSGNRTCTSCMEGKVLTTGLPEKSLNRVFCQYVTKNRKNNYIFCGGNNSQSILLRCETGF